MTGIYNGTDLVSKYIKVTFQHSVKRVVNSLLDGSEHVQIIGNPVERVRVDIVVDDIGMAMLNSSEASGTLLTLNDENGGVNYGRILDKAEWEKLKKGLYQTYITMSIEAVT